MATQKQINSCVYVLTGLDTAVSDTFVTQCANITDKLSSVYGIENWDIPKDDVEKMIVGITEKAPWKDKPERQVAARQSEYRAVIKGYPFLKSGAKTFKAEYGQFGKEHMLKIARTGIQYQTAKDAALDAVTYFEEKDKAKGKGKASQHDKLVAAAKTFRNNCEGSKMLAAFDKFLKAQKLYNEVTK